MIVINTVPLLYLTILLLKSNPGVAEDITMTNNISCSTFDNDLQESLKLYYTHYYDDDQSLTSKNPIVQFFVYKILEDRGNGLQSLEKAFADNVKQDILIKYEMHIPCGGEQKKCIETDYTYTEHKVLAGILKRIGNNYNQQKVIKLTIDITTDDGFDEECHELSVCQGKHFGKFHDTKGQLEIVFCQVTMLLFLNWAEQEISTVENIHWTCYLQWLSSIEIVQRWLFIFAVGLFHLIIFVLLVRYRFKIQKYISIQTRGNKVRSLLFWSLITSVSLLYIYSIVIGMIASNRIPSGQYYLWSLLIPTTGLFDIYFYFFVLLHILVACCCMCICNKKASSTVLCIPGTCFSKFPVCSYPFQSFAFCVLNIIPHTVLSFISYIFVQLSAPIPSVTVLLYFVLLLFANVVINAITINLMTTSVYKINNNEHSRQSFLSKCCYLLFGCIIAFASNIMTVIIIISLVDYLMNSSEQSSYSAILPGVILAVCGWYFSGDITRYTGIDLSLNRNKTNENVTQDVENGISYRLMEDAHIKTS